MTWQSILKSNPLPWLLEPDNPGVRYLALRHLLDLPADNPELLEARSSAYRTGPLADVLNAMHPDGYWVKAGPGYSPKYTSTVWAISLLGQLGARIEDDPRIHQACQYLLDHALTAYGQFSYNGSPGGTIDCLQGNLCTALLDLGCIDPRLDRAVEWMARSNTGEGMTAAGDKSTPIRYYAYKCGPAFICGANNKQGCAWGAVKVMLAFSKLPPEKRTPLVEAAIQTGVDFLLGVDPATAAYPTGETAHEPNRSWWKFGFPVYYVTDLLQNVEALARLGYGKDPRLAHALQLILEKQDAQGRWALEYDYTGKTWGNYGKKKTPNKWVTLRALRVLKAAYS